MEKTCIPHQNWVPNDTDEWQWCNESAACQKKCAESLKNVEQVSMMMIVLVSSAHQVKSGSDSGNTTSHKRPPVPQ